MIKADETDTDRKIAWSLELNMDSQHFFFTSFLRNLNVCRIKAKI